MLDQEKQLSLNEKQTVYNQSWKRRAQDLYVLNRKLSKQDSKRLTTLIGQLEILIDTATSNVTLTSNI